MTYAAAIKHCRTLPMATHATGDALCAMYADLVAVQHGFDQRTAGAFIYPHLCNCRTDADIHAEAKELMANRDEAWNCVTGRRNSTTAPSA